jgi:hypothetical protein
MRLKDFLNEQAEELGAISGQPPRDGSSPDGSYGNHLDSVQSQLDKITELLSSHIEGQSDTSDQWSHASDLAGVAEKLQEVIDMLSGDDEETDDVHVTESFKVGDSVMAKSIAGPRRGTITKIGSRGRGRGKFPQIMVKYEVKDEPGKFITIGFPPEKVTKVSTVSEGTNSNNERTIANFSKWKASCRSKHAGVWFSGDKDICEAMVGPNPYKRGETKGVGHFEEGDGGTVD